MQATKDSVRSTRETIYRELRARGVDKNQAKTKAYDIVREAVANLQK